MGILDAIRMAGDVIDKLKNAELKSLMADIRMEAVTLAEQNVKLREELMQLREDAKNRATVLFRTNLFWTVTPDGEAGPFCPKCWPKDSRLVQMITTNQDDLWKCPVCTSMIRSRVDARDQQQDDFPSPREPIR
jgi:hypothetical protein